MRWACPFGKSEHVTLVGDEDITEDENGKNKTVEDSNPYGDAGDFTATTNNNS